MAMKTTICPGVDTLRDFLNQTLTEQQTSTVEEHLSGCNKCQSLLEDLSASNDEWNEAFDAVRTVDFVADDQGPAFDHSLLLNMLGPTDDPAMLGRVGAYEITALLGHGGMGVVFKGFDRSLNRYVAIKMLLPHLAASSAARQRFAREAQAAAAVVDDHVMAVHHVDAWQGVPYLVMPYAKGVSLQKRLNDDGALQLREILRIGLQASRGLAAAHAQGLVHRDVKPANIFLSDNVERVRLMDFGLARAADDASLTRTGVLAGTPQYMSPEQARAEKIDFRSDLFSLGSVLYTMCTGRPPFRAESSHSVLRLITDKEPTPIREVNSDIPEWLCSVIGKLMAKDADQRFESANDAADLLEACLAHVQQPDAVPLPVELQPQPASQSRFRSWLKLLACVGGIAILLFGGLFLAAAAPDISGKWVGEEGGTVEIQADESKSGAYVGSFTEAFAGKPVTIKLKWSRIERRYNGTWRLSDDSFGKLSVRKVGNKIRGARTISRKSDTAPGQSRLTDFTWTRFATVKASTTLMLADCAPGEAAVQVHDPGRLGTISELITADKLLRKGHELVADNGVVSSIKNRLSVSVGDWIEVSLIGAPGAGAESTRRELAEIVYNVNEYLKEAQQDNFEEALQLLRTAQEKLASDSDNGRDTKLMASVEEKIQELEQNQQTQKLVVIHPPALGDKHTWAAQRRATVDARSFSAIRKKIDSLDDLPLQLKVTDVNPGQGSVGVTFSIVNTGSDLAEATSIAITWQKLDGKAGPHPSNLEHWTAMDVSPKRASKFRCGLFPDRPFIAVVYGPYDLRSGFRKPLGKYVSKHGLTADFLATKTTVSKATDSKQTTDGHDLLDDELNRSLSGIMDVVNKRPQVSMTPEFEQRWGAEIARMHTCSGHRGIGFDRGLIVENAGFVYSEYVIDGTRFVLEVSAVKKEGKWEIELIRVENEENIHRDVRQFLAKYPHAKPVNFRSATKTTTGFHGQAVLQFVKHVEDRDVVLDRAAHKELASIAESDAVVEAAQRELGDTAATRIDKKLLQVSQVVGNTRAISVEYQSDNADPGGKVVQAIVNAMKKHVSDNPNDADDKRTVRFVGGRIFPITTDHILPTIAIRPDLGSTNGRSAIVNLQLENKSAAEFFVKTIRIATTNRGAYGGGSSYGPIRQSMKQSDSTEYPIAIMNGRPTTVMLEGFRLSDATKTPKLIGKVTFLFESDQPQASSNPTANPANGSLGANSTDTFSDVDAGTDDSSDSMAALEHTVANMMAVLRGDDKLNALANLFRLTAQEETFGLHPRSKFDFVLRTVKNLSDRNSMEVNFFSEAGGVVGMFQTQPFKNNDGEQKVAEVQFRRNGVWQLADIQLISAKDAQESQKRFLRGNLNAHVVQLSDEFHEMDHLLQSHAIHKVAVWTNGREANLLQAGSHYDIHAKIQGNDPADDMVLDVVRSARVVAFHDAHPREKRKRLVTLIVSVSREQQKALQAHEHRKSFTYTLLRPEDLDYRRQSVDGDNDDLFDGPIDRRSR